MLTQFQRLSIVAILAICGSAARAADVYTVDPVHSSISFRISHQGISDIHGRFNDYSGTFTIDRADPSKSSFELSVKVESVDTNNQKRDEHLRAPDYFNVKQFPAMTFKSKKVKPTDDGYEVTGDLTLHGVTKEITLDLKGGHKEIEFPKGSKRIGVTATPTIDRTQFGMRSEKPGLGDDVNITLGIEAAKM
jgi:polyisoprenoid-binding protein YceI